MIDFLIENLEHVQWNNFISNSAAIDYLIANPDQRIEQHIVDLIWSNPNIFTYDYELILSSREDLNRDIVEYCYHPDRVLKLGFEEFDWLNDESNQE